MNAAIMGWLSFNNFKFKITNQNFVIRCGNEYKEYPRIGGSPEHLNNDPGFRVQDS